MEDPRRLPLERGDTYIKRVYTIYADLFKDKYGFSPTINFGRFAKSVKELIDMKSEMQIAALLIIFFNWTGMNGDDEWEQNKLLENAHNPTWFFSTITKYELYLRKMYGLDLDDAIKTREFVAESISKLKK